MRFIEGLNRFISAYIETLKGFSRVSVILPMFLFMIFQMIMLMVLTNFYRPPVDGLLVPLLSKLFGDAITHYPTIYSALWSIFTYMNLVFSFIIGTIFVGMAFFMFASFFEGEGLSLKSSFKATISKFHLLLILWIIENGIVLALIYFPSHYLSEFFMYSLKRELFFRLSLSVVGAVAAALFAYTTAEVVLARSSLWKSIMASFRLFKENSITTFFLVMIPVLLRFPFEFMNNKSAMLTGKLTPEFVVIIIAVGLFATFVANFFLIGGVTRIYISEKH